MKKFLALTLSTAMVAGMMAPAAFADETEAMDILPGDGQKIGVSMPTKDLQRWNQDGENMQTLLETA